MELQYPRGESGDAGLIDIDGNGRSRTPSFEQIDHRHFLDTHLPAQQASLDSHTGRIHDRKPKAYSTSSSSSRISIKALGKTRTIDLASDIRGLEQHHDSALYPSTSAQTNRSRPRAHSADATLSRKPRADNEELDVIDQYQEDHQLHHQPSLTRLKSKSEADLPTAAQRPRRPKYTRNWFSDGGGSSMNRRYHQKLERKIQRFQSAARKKCKAINPDFCRVHGAMHQHRNIYLQSMPDVDPAETPLEVSGLAGSIFDLEEKCGTRLPSPATTVSDVEAGLEVGVPPRRERRVREVPFHWQIMCSPYLMLFIILAIIALGGEVGRQLHSQGSA
ncbi:hypothetical protein Q7P37_003865 [Cladosporium fusiforme]